MRALTVIAGAAALALTAAATAAAAETDIDIPFEKFQLDNGLTVIVHEDHKAPVVAVSVWYKVGSKDEPDGKTGFAHLFEHLMFNGSDNYNDDWFKPLQEVGATGLNGTTNFDRTNYFETVPVNAFDRIMWMESDRMGHLLGVMDQAKLDEQRGVVQNEKRQGENQPYGRAFDVITSSLFPVGHPYHHSTIGSMADLDAASLDDVKAWFKKYYGPSNAILVLAGDIDTKTAKAKAEEYFGDIPAGPPLTKWDAWIPKRTEPSRQTMYDQVPQARIYRVWVTPQDNSRAATDLFTAASILGDGKNSRLYKDLVYDRQIATDVSVFNYELQMASIFGVVATVKPGEDVDAVTAQLDKDIADFLKTGPTKDEVKLVSVKTKASTIRGLEEVGGFGGKAVTLAHGELVAGDPGFFKTELNWLDEETPERVADAARSWLNDGYFQLDVLPYAKYSASGDGVDRSTGLPGVTGNAKLTFPAVETAELKNGIKVVFARRTTIPVVEMSMQFDAGYAADQGAKLGTAGFTMAMLDEGAGKRDALAISAELDRLGATLSAGSSLDTSTVSLSALKENLKPSLDLMADVVRNPTFPDKEISRVRKQWLARIQQELSSPVSIALRLLPPLIYGENNAYGIPFTGSGTQQSIQSLTRDDMVKFQSQWLRPDNATLFVVGDTTLAEITPMLERAFGNWTAPHTAKPTKNLAHVDLPAAARVIIVDRPGSPQSFILAGNVAPPTGAPNNIAISAMNDTLGGTFVSRLNMNLREDKHWSYGVQSFLWGAKGQRPFMVFAPVQTDKTKESIAEIVKELKGVVGANPPTTDEISKVKLDNVRSLPGQYETSDAVLGSLTSSARYGRPWNYPETLPTQYDALTAAEAEAAAKEVVHPGQMVWVIIGDKEKIEAGVRSLNLGPVEVKAMSDL